MADEPGHDINYIGLGGALAAMGRADDPPFPPLNLVGDYGGGALYLAVGILAALQSRSRTGQGDVIDVAMIDGIASLMGPTFQMLDAGFWRDERGVNLLDGGAPFYTTYATADDRYVAVGALEPAFYAALVAGLGLDEAELPDRFDETRWPELRTVFAERFGTRDRDEWIDHFTGKEACVTPVLTLGEVAAHPHHRARGTFVDGKGRWAPAPAPRFTRSVLASREEGRSATADDVLAGCGVSVDRIRAARGRGIID